MLRQLAIFALVLVSISNLVAELSVPAVFTDHMVLRRDQANKVWGWDEPGAKISVSFAGKKYKSTADEQGTWNVSLDPNAANSNPKTLSIKGTSRLEIKDVLVGEVWICSGQSNMRWILRKEVNGDLNGLAAANDMIRLFRVPSVGSQEPKNTFSKQWELCTPESAADFSAAGFYYGRYLQKTLGIPVGLIDNAWGGSAAGAWVNRKRLAAHPELGEINNHWKEREIFLTGPASETEHQAKLAEWEIAKKEAKDAGRWVPCKPLSPQQVLSGNQRPGNLYNGVLHATIGYGIKGVIWYQGESNVGRAKAYQSLLPLLMQNWHEEWGQGDFPFYWVQLADFPKEQDEPQDSNWAALREAQTMALSLPNTGQAEIIDLGEAKDIHPCNKYEVASRLVRWALVKDYGYHPYSRKPPHPIRRNRSAIGGNLRHNTVSCPTIPE